MTDPRIGTQLGGYEIDSLLGHGGMGVVYKARHLRLGRMVALKVLAPQYSTDENFRARFVREAEMAASIDHPNVIPVYDADEVDGVLYLAMRYVEGTDLKNMVAAGGPLDVEAALMVASQIGGALDAAHARGLIHRDIKPANVLIATSDTGPPHVYLTDFGLTKHGSSKSGLTASGAFVGTIDYIAPEQIEGKAVDARSDIYAFGCVIYECLTGQVPFVKETDVAVMYAHMMDPRPRVTEARPELPDGVDGVLEKAMARDPAERYPTATELVTDLRNVLSGQPSTAAVVQPVSQPESKPVVEPVVEAEPPAEEAKAKESTGPKKVTGRRLGVAMIVALFMGAAIAIFVTVALFLSRESDSEPDRPVSSPTVVDAPVPGDAIFVAPDGSAGASGTSDDPVATLREAVAMADDGGTVILADGTYEAETTPMVVIDHPVTIRGATDAVPVLQGSDEHPDGIRIPARTSGVTISNLTFDGFAGEALKVFCETCDKSIENRDVTLEDLEFTKGGTPLTIENIAGLTLQRVNVHDNNFTGMVCSPGPCDDVTIVDSFFHSGAHRFAEGVRIEKGNNVLIETSDLSSNPGNGFFSNASETRVSRSRFQDNGGAGAFITGSDSEIRDSIAARNGEQGLILGEGSCDGCSTTGTFTIANVLVTDNVEGIRVENDKSDEIVLEMFNSILTNNEGTALNITGAVRVERLDKNLFHSPTRWLAITFEGEGYNDEELNDGLFPGNVDAGSYALAPSFVATDDFHLTPDSAGVGEGTEDGVTSEKDIDGNPRVAGTGIDMGPYEQ